MNTSFINLQFAGLQNLQGLKSDGTRNLLGHVIGESAAKTLEVLKTSKV